MSGFAKLRRLTRRLGDKYFSHSLIKYWISSYVTQSLRVRATPVIPYVTACLWLNESSPWLESTIKWMWISGSIWLIHVGSSVYDVLPPTPILRHLVMQIWLCFHIGGSNQGVALPWQKEEERASAGSSTGSMPGDVAIKAPRDVIMSTMPMCRGQ